MGTATLRVFGIEDPLVSFSLIVIGILFFLIVPGTIALGFLDRKLGANLQARIGPNRTGWRGILQPFADFLKLSQKNGSASFGSGELFWMGLALFFLFSNIGVVPFSRHAVLFDSPLALMLPLLLLLCFSFATLLLGFGQATVNGWFGGIRGIAQSVVGLLPAMTSLLALSLQTGDLSWANLIQTQSDGIFSWNAFSNPFLGLASVIYLCAGLVMLGLKPFDVSASRIDLHGGILSQMYGRRLILFRLLRGYGFLLWVVMTVHLFFGGWSLPFALDGVVSDLGSIPLSMAVDIGVLGAKSAILALFVFWVAKVNPKPRADQVTDFTWKYLASLSILNLLAVLLWKGFVHA